MSDTNHPRSAKPVAWIIDLYLAGQRYPILPHPILASSLARAARFLHDRITHTPFSEFMAEAWRDGVPVFYRLNGPGGVLVTVCRLDCRELRGAEGLDSMVSIE